MGSIDDVRAVAQQLPGVTERMRTGGVAWFVGSRLFAWEYHPWPSIPEEIRAVIRAELVIGVKVTDANDARALRQMFPDAFLPQTTTWGEPKVAFRAAQVDAILLRELVTDAWLAQAPAVLRRAWLATCPQLTPDDAAQTGDGG